MDARFFHIDFGNKDLGFAKFSCDFKSVIVLFGYVVKEKRIPGAEVGNNNKKIRGV